MLDRLLCGVDGPPRLRARSASCPDAAGAWKNLVSDDMFYHLEHHLFPAVPTSRLPELAARLDKVISQVTAKQVF